MNEKKMLANLKELRESKDVDLIAESIREIIGMYGLTMAEVAAVNYYIMEQALKTPVNRVFLKERMEIDIDSLGVDGILQVQRALVATYAGQVKKEENADV
ncbi:hypothetical protein [Enterococcus sp. AZ007]|uniref:hypothetical protein n=1 Tax=Enterococcus sp. AZ007 TaxID=2774839 RepID=UPI003F25AC8C